MKAPYLDMDGLYFQQKENPSVRTTNIRIAIETLRRFITDGGSQSDVMVAIDYIDETNPHVIYLTKQLKNYLFLDEEVADTYSKRMCARLYNLIGEKIS